MSSRPRIIAAAAVLVLVAAAVPSSITASERPLPPRPTDIRPADAVAFGDWYFSGNGRVVCESPGYTFMLLYNGTVKLTVPLPSLP
jgi:hypothetical protein